MLLRMSTNGRSRPSSMPGIDRDLLEAAKALVRDGHAAAAVVSAHAATEVVSELVIGVLLEIRGLPELERPLKKLARFHSRNDGVRQMYEALSGDDLGTTELWQ